MTDIFDFRGKAFKTYIAEWDLVFRTIFKATEVSGNTHEYYKYHRFFKKNKPDLWEKGCPDEVILEFIVRARMISHYVLIDLPERGEKKEWFVYKCSATGEWKMEEVVGDDVVKVAIAADAAASQCAANAAVAAASPRAVVIEEVN